MIDGNTAALNAFMEQQDRAAQDDDLKQAWRKRRQIELECGMAPGAIMDAIEHNMRELDVLWDFVFGANKPGDEGILAVRELMARLIQRTLDFELARGDWK